MLVLNPVRSPCRSTIPLRMDHSDPSLYRQDSRHRIANTCRPRSSCCDVQGRVFFLQNTGGISGPGRIPGASRIPSCPNRVACAFPHCRIASTYGPGRIRQPCRTPTRPTRVRVRPNRQHCSECICACDGNCRKTDIPMNPSGGHSSHRLDCVAFDGSSWLSPSSDGTTISSPMAAPQWRSNCLTA